MKKPVNIVILSIIAILVIIAVIGITYYNSMIGPVNKQGTEIEIEIEQGDAASTIGKKLKEKNLINSDFVFDIYVKLNKVNNMKAGSYTLNQNMSLKEIINTLQSGEDLSQKSINITFLEGKNMKWIAKTIAQNTNNTEEDVFKVLKDEQYLNEIIQKYWFINEDIKDSKIYYSLEGYLFPDTYNFKNNEVTVKEIFNTMLDEMENKLEKNKTEIESSRINVHKLFTLASIVELESANQQDKAGVASVFYNRLKYNMPLGSDVTTYYAFKIDMAERALKQSELDTYNPYNTRGPNMNGKLPIGPICTIAEDSIEAALHPIESKYLYFVADKNGKVYYAESNSEHQKNINYLKKNNLWYTYE